MRYNPYYMNIRLERLNSMILPFLKLNVRARDLRNLAAGYHRRLPNSIIRIEYSSDYTLATLLIDLTDYGARRPVKYTFYVSAQKSPIRPYQFVSKYYRMKKHSMKFNAECDSYYILLARKVTSTVARELRRLRIHHASRPEKALEFIAEYFRKRLTALVNAIRGKRIWGPLALLVLILSRIVKQLTGKRPEEIDEYTELKLVQAIDTPATVFT